MKRTMKNIYHFHRAFCVMKNTEIACKEAINNTSNKLVFYINGKRIEDDTVDPDWTLLHYIRKKLYIHGTRMGCSEGGCGCCTVMFSHYDFSINKVLHYPVNSCLAPICSVHGFHVTTAEGIGSSRTTIHPIQERIVKAHGMQCGFCSPGFVTSMYSLLRQNLKPKMKTIAETFQGNLCRCTGYRPILEGFRTFSREWLDEYKENSNLSICAMQSKCNIMGFEAHERLFKTEEFTPYDPAREPDLPKDLKVDKYSKEFLKIVGPLTTWLRPTTLAQLTDIKIEHPMAKIVAGNTITRFDTRFGSNKYPFMVLVKSIQEMKDLFVTENGLRIGAASSLERIRIFLKEHIKTFPPEKTRLFIAISDLIHWMASKQIRSVCTMGGNIMTSNPACDLLPILIASRVLLEVCNAKGTRFITLDGTIVGIRKTALDPSDVLVAIHLPFSKENEYFRAYKQSKRREVDVSVVNLAVRVEFEKNSDIISAIFFGIGGVAEKSIEAPITQEKLKGLPWNKDTLKQSYSFLLKDISLDWEAPGGNVRYRQCLALSLFLRSYLSISQDLCVNLKKDPKDFFDSRELSGILKFDKKAFRSSQHFPTAPATQPANDAVQRPMVRPSALSDACGEAIFLNDIPGFNHELYLAYVWSTRAHANIVSLDASEALKMKGVHAFISEDSISKEINLSGAVFNEDEQIFYSKKVTSQGQIIGAIIADNPFLARKAARRVHVKYEDLKPLVLTVEDAIEHKSFFKDVGLEINHGNVDEILKTAPFTIKGSCRTSNQKHIYMETQRCVAVPVQDGGFSIFSSTQSPSLLAKRAAAIANTPQNKIKVHVKRLGSGIGGKRWKSIVIAQPVIVAAKIFQRPIRCVLDRDEDMLMLGGRIPYLFYYKVGFDERGKILACDFDVYANCGYSLETSHLVLKNALYHLDNAFNIPALRAKGQLCKTNIPSNPLMKGLGGPEGQFPITYLLEEIAEHLQKDSLEIYETNMYKDGDKTFYGTKLNNFHLRQCWYSCLKNFNYQGKKEDISIFNKENRHKKRGLSAIPTKMGLGIEYLHPSFVQVAALINVYTDGSVLLSVGGVEMGQGLYTKMIQIATRVLNIPAHKIHIEETSTNIVPNCTSTTGSIDIHFNGQVVFKVCKKILKRIEPYANLNPNGTWEEWVKEANSHNVNLSATATYTPAVMLDNENTDQSVKSGISYEYFVCGAACSMVEIDTLTGDHQILATDIVVDLGNSLNPAIDIGQIEGGFMQGYGLFVMEETLYSPTGTLYTKGPVSYKIPGLGDIPADFNVTLLKGLADPGVIFPIKSADEASQILGSSIYYAIKDAIKAARTEYGETTAFQLRTPATTEVVRLNCMDPILKKVLKGYRKHKPWTVTL